MSSLLDDAAVVRELEMAQQVLVKLASQHDIKAAISVGLSVFQDGEYHVTARCAWNSPVAVFGIIADLLRELQEDDRASLQMKAFAAKMMRRITDRGWPLSRAH